MGAEPASFDWLQHYILYLVYDMRQIFSTNIGVVMTGYDDTNNTIKSITMFDINVTWKCINLIYTTPQNKYLATFAYTYCAASKHTV